MGFADGLDMECEGRELRVSQRFLATEKMRSGKLQEKQA